MIGNSAPINLGSKPLYTISSVFLKRIVVKIKFDVHSLYEFDQLLTEHPEIESEMLEDFQGADYLTHRIEEISQWINE